jgi:4-hydroxythreonine-4-phosphate dehydrogenase
MADKKDDRIKVAITSGDPNGVGMEVIVQALSDPRITDMFTPIIYANPELVKLAKKAVRAEEFNYNSVASAGEAIAKKVNLVNVWKEKVTFEPGKADKEAGTFAFRSLEAAAADLAANKVDVLVTAPIDKDTINAAGFQFPGHTEYLASMAGTDKVLMFLVSDVLKIGIVTGHVPLKDVAQNITKDRILLKLNMMSESLSRDFGIRTPKIAVLGLNPHAGDNGLLGAEEKDIIIPAIREATEKGIYAFGPYGADGFFGSGAYKKFDGVLAMYHDQGLAPFKAIAFDRGVNFTAGLPIVRTSPAHGVAYDLAGKGNADASSMRAAIFEAIDIYFQRKEHREMSANPLKKQDIRDEERESPSRLL